MVGAQSKEVGVEPLPMRVANLGWSQDVFLSWCWNLALGVGCWHIFLKKEKNQMK
jgi:hypothetical protein